MTPGTSAALPRRDAARIQRVGTEVDLVAVEIAVAIAVGQVGIGAEGGFVGVGQPVAIAVAAASRRRTLCHQRVGARGNLRAVENAVRVAIGTPRVGAVIGPAGDDRGETRDE